MPAATATTAATLTGRAWGPAGRLRSRRMRRVLPWMRSVLRRLVTGVLRVPGRSRRAARLPNVDHDRPVRSRRPRRAVRGMVTSSLLAVSRISAWRPLLASAVPVMLLRVLRLAARVVLLVAPLRLVSPRRRRLLGLAARLERRRELPAHEGAPDLRHVPSPREQAAVEAAEEVTEIVEIAPEEELGAAVVGRRDELGEVDDHRSIRAEEDVVR